MLQSDLGHCSGPINAKMYSVAHSSPRPIRAPPPLTLMYLKFSLEIIHEKIFQGQPQKLWAFLGSIFRHIVTSLMIKRHEWKGLIRNTPAFSSKSYELASRQQL